MESIQELREMSDEQLELTLKDARRRLFDLRVQSQTERTDAPSEIRRNRKLVAQVKTLQTQRVLAGASGEQANAAGTTADA